MESQTNITQTIINTINSIFEMLFSSIDNNLYSVLDKITFINSDILTDKNFENIFGTSTSNGILLIANSLLLGLILYYGFKYLMSHITYQRVDSPFSFIIKIIIFGKSLCDIQKNTCLHYKLMQTGIELFLFFSLFVLFGLFNVAFVVRF